MKEFITVCIVPVVTVQHVHFIFNIMLLMSVLRPFDIKKSIAE